MDSVLGIIKPTDIFDIRWAWLRVIYGYRCKFQRSRSELLSKIPMTSQALTFWTPLVTERGITIWMIHCININLRNNNKTVWVFSHMYDLAVLKHCHHNLNEAERTILLTDIKGSSSLMFKHFFYPSSVFFTLILFSLDSEIHRLRSSLALRPSMFVQSLSTQAAIVT